MNDYEINKRLAEIAGGFSRIDALDAIGCCQVVRDGNCYPWSPLTDWSQLGPLMERLFVQVDFRLGPPAMAMAYIEAGKCDGTWIADPDLKRAICLAIIAAHQEARE